jgi:rhamnulokinase
VEATAIGSVLIQARALGRIASHEELREVVRRSFPLDTYQPKPTAYWARAYGQFKKLKQG